MAVFDKKVPSKVSLDDTATLISTIENSQTVNGHTEYIIKVQRGPQPEHFWLLCKRYSDFVALHNVTQGYGFKLELPPKKFLGNMNKTFVAQRQAELQNYLNVLLANPMLALSLSVRRFLDPHNYATALQELALQNVSMALRSEANYELIKPLGDIGWRFRKHNFLVKSKLNPKLELILQWVEYGPDKYLEDKELQNILKCFINLNHPHIEKLEYIHCDSGGCFIVRQLHQCGTLRDMIYNTKPKSHFLRKYGNPKNSKQLSFSEISVFGRQILETLIFLHSRGIPFGHLHSGNILILDNNIKLLDIENTILGLPSFYRPYFVQHKKVNTMEAIDVYSFGHVLFEMAFGYPLNETFCDNIPSICPSLLRVLLESILSSESCKLGLPSLNEVLQHPFFNVSSKTDQIKVNFKLSSNLKLPLVDSIKHIEKRLQDDKKAIRYQKKISRLNKQLASENKELSGKQRLKGEKDFDKEVMKETNPNGKKLHRSDSLTSSSTAASVGAVTPPLPAAKHQITNPVSTSAVQGRSALLNSICAFNKADLRHRPTTVLNGS